MATSVAYRCWLMGWLLPTFACAQNLPPPAYQLAASDRGIPPEVLYAVALTETGLFVDNQQTIRPWPWTLNIAGQGRFFRSRDDACIALTQALTTTPAKRVDVGLNQINYGYHGTRVSYPCELLDPYLNLAIAADLLKLHHRHGEDWLLAIGRYHSPAGGKQAARYRAIAIKYLQKITSQTTQVNP